MCRPRRPCWNELLAPYRTRITYGCARCGAAFRMGGVKISSTRQAGDGSADACDDPAIIDAGALARLDGGVRTGRRHLRANQSAFSDLQHLRRHGDDRDHWLL